MTNTPSPAATAPGRDRLTSQDVPGWYVGSNDGDEMAFYWDGEIYGMWLTNGVTQGSEKTKGYRNFRGPLVVTSASEVRLREELDAALRELDWIDSVLARRPALADQPTRAAKIEHAISTAAKADQLQSRLAAAERELEAVKGERDKRADELRVLRAIAEGGPDAGRLFGHCCEDALRIEKVLSYALPVSPAQGDGK